MAHVPGFSRVTALMSVGSLFANAATEMLVPILPIFLTQSLGATGSVVGLVDGVAQALRNLLDGFSGALSDHFRQRKAFVLTGYALSAIAKPLMGVSTVWQSVLAARLLDRLGAGIRSAPRDALIVSSLDSNEEARGFGLESLGENAGAFVGPLLTLFFSLHCKPISEQCFTSPLFPASLDFLLYRWSANAHRPPASGHPPSLYRVFQNRTGTFWQLWQSSAWVIRAIPFSSCAFKKREAPQHL
jgi:hypothetical protein